MLRAAIPMKIKEYLRKIQQLPEIQRKKMQIWVVAAVTVLFVLVSLILGSLSGKKEPVEDSGESLQQAVSEASPEIQELNEVFGKISRIWQWTKEDMRTLLEDEEFKKSLEAPVEQKE